MRSLQQLEEEFKKLKAATGSGMSASVGPVGNGSAGGGGGGGGGRSSGVPVRQWGREKSAQDCEKQSRTITFGQFPIDMQAAKVKTFIEGVLANVSEELEEVFAYGKKRAERGAARFKTEAAMWKYMTDHAGKHRHTFEGIHVYCNADGASRSPDDEHARKEKAVRKVVRTLIEANGGDGQSVKQDIDTNYTKGIVWWKDERVAEWSNGAMELKGKMVPYTDAYNRLMGKE